MKIELVNVSHWYETSFGDLEVLKNVNLVIEDGEFVVVVGDNGSGKSTFLQILALLIKPKEGKILYDGHDPWKEPKRWRKKIGFSFQFPENQFFSFTVYDEVIYSAKNFLGHVSDDLYTNAMKSVDLQPEEYRERSPFTLSGGEKRKVGIASIISHDPEVLLLDEPLVSLDWPSRCDIKEFLKNWKLKGKSAVIVSHYPEFFKGIYDRILEFPL